jgi:hypothetical protein
MLCVDARLAAARSRAGAARLKLFDDVLHDPSKLQHTTRMLTVGALGNDIAPPGVAAIAARSSAASAKSRCKMSVWSSLASAAVAPAFMVANPFVAPRVEAS